MNSWNNEYEVTFGRVTEGVKWLLLATILAYVVQWMLMNAGLGVNRALGLSLDGLQHFFVWQVVTYMFLHGSLFHLLLNMLVLFMMGPETERAMGRSQFMTMYFFSGILGGIGWLIISAWEDPLVPCVGASGAVFGVIGAFAALFPHRHITLLLFFVLPVTMKAWVLAAILGGLELSFLLSHSSAGGVANAAHLAGGVAGFIYAYMAFRKGTMIRLPRTGRKKMPGFFSRRKSPDVNMKEVDRILDKIEREGMHSLTRAERDLLHKKSREMRG